MYRRPIFLEALIAIRQEMAREADYDVDLFAETVRSGKRRRKIALHSMSEPLSDAGTENAKRKKSREPKAA